MPVQKIVVADDCVDAGVVDVVVGVVVIVIVVIACVTVFIVGKVILIGAKTITTIEFRVASPPRMQVNIADYLGCICWPVLGTVDTDAL